MRSGSTTPNGLEEGIEKDVYKAISKNCGITTRSLSIALAHVYDHEDVAKTVRMLKSRDLIRKSGTDRHGLILWRAI